MNTDTRVPAVPRFLGYAGLIPFLALSLGLWVTPQQYASDLHQALLAYGAVILSFMGAIHWGAAIDLENPTRQKQLGWSVIPALFAWPALLLPPVYGYSVLIVAFVGLCVVDSFLTRRALLPRWYPRLRVPLTAVVVISLIAAQTARVFA